MAALRRPATAAHGGAGGTWGGGEDSPTTGTSTADADAFNDVSQFNQQIVMGANLQGNTVDMTVVGNDLTSNFAEDDLTA